jgi:uncharacterized protein (DUF1501 family)
MNHPKQSRREFLNGACGLVAAGGISSFVPQLNIMGTALAQSNTGGYKTLVCLYLDGGNDSWNLAIPASAAAGGAFDHGVYTTARNGLYTAANTQGLGIPRPGTGGGLNLPSAIALTPSGGNLAMNPFAPELANLYNNGRLAIVPNVGTLVQPLTRAEYNNRPKPPQLYSHNDQTNLWQIGGGGSSTLPRGFGGNIAGATFVPNAAPGNGLSPAISISGSNRFLVGQTLAAAAISPVQLSTSATTPATTLNNYNAVTTANGESVRRAALQDLLDIAYPQLFSQEASDIFEGSLTLANVVNTQFSNGSANIATTFPNTSIGNQLRQVARMIKISRPTVNGSPGFIQANRQVFFTRTGGYDTHDDQITSVTAAQGHHGLLQQISQAVNAFYNAMVEIGAQDEVVLFSMSEFARTINSNGNGTDHAWGSLQFVVGGPGAVAGGQTYGRYPSMKLDNRIGGTGAVMPDQGECFSRGQFLPTIATDQYGATLARWMGVDDANLPLIFPNIANFAPGGQFANATATPTFAYFNRVIPNLLNGIS